MALFGLFNKKRQVPALNFQSIGTDMHSHILPGIDDGAPEMKDSIAMAIRFKALGFKKIIATPHIMADYFRNTPDRINRALDKVRDALTAQNIDIVVDAAAEYYLDETFEKKIQQKELMTFGDNHVLFELSYINMPHNLETTVKQLKDAGYNPVLAHPERYPYFHGGIENYLQIRELGCALQVNTIALTGYYGKGAKKISEELIEHGVVDFLGSDMHHLRHADALAAALELPALQEFLSNHTLKNGGI